MFKSGPYRPPKGRFGRTKRLGGHVNVDSMKRCFLSAGSPASSPAKSRLVEAICILLCAQYPQPRRERGQRPRYTSRWKLVLSAYNAIRARLLNSQALLEETNLVLYTINETTLVRWYKNTTRRDEVTLLLQGLSLPSPSACSSSTLPPPQARPVVPPPPPDQPHSFPDPEDTLGQAQVQGAPAPTTSSTPPPDHTGSISRTTEWRRRKKTAAVPTTSAEPPPEPPPDPTISRTSEWRWKRKTEQPTATKMPRKAYSCQFCMQPMNAATGHSQFHGRCYGLHAPGQIPREEWMAQRKAEAAAKVHVAPQEDQ